MMVLEFITGILIAYTTASNYLADHINSLLTPSDVPMVIEEKNPPLSKINSAYSNIKAGLILLSTLFERWNLSIFLLGQKVHLVVAAENRKGIKTANLSPHLLQVTHSVG